MFSSPTNTEEPRESKVKPPYPPLHSLSLLPTAECTDRPHYLALVLPPCAYAWIYQALVYQTHSTTRPINFLDSNTMSEMAASGLSAEPSDPDYHSQSGTEHDMASPTLPRIPLFVPSQYWTYHVHSPVGDHCYPVQQYLSSHEMTLFGLPFDSYEHWQDEYNTLPSNTATLDSATQGLDPDDFLETAVNVKRSTLTATAPPFIPVKSSTLNAAAPTFFLSRLATFDPPAGDLAKRPQKYNRVLPDARKDEITDALVMMRRPRDGQVGRFTDETTYEFNKNWQFNDPVLASMYHTMIAPKKHNFAAFALRVNIRPVNDAPPLWPPYMNLFDIKSYYFEIIEKDSEKQAK